MTAPSVVARRLAAQLLTDRAATTVDAVVRRLLAVQAQDPRGFRLAVRARSTGLSAADVDAALADRRVVVSWLNRGTLHLVLADDYWWLHPLVTPPARTANTRRLRQEGVTATQAARGVAVVADAVATEGPLTREALRARLDDARVPTAGQALVHVLFEAALEGTIVRGPVVGAAWEQAFVAPDAWLGRRPRPVTREDALARLAARYVEGHGPADGRDLARWAGLPQRDVAGALADALGDAGGTRRLPRPTLVGAFDPVLLGWSSGTGLVAAGGESTARGGLFRPAALVGGRVVATWRLARRAGATLELDEWAPIPTAARRALEREAADVVRFLS